MGWKWNKPWIYWEQRSGCYAHIQSPVFLKCYMHDQGPPLNTYLCWFSRQLWSRHPVEMNSNNFCTMCPLCSNISGLSIVPTWTHPCKCSEHDNSITYWKQVVFTCAYSFIWCESLLHYLSNEHLNWRYQCKICSSSSEAGSVPASRRNKHWRPQTH